MQFFDLNLAPNGMRELQVQGGYVYFLDGSAGGADSTIALRKGAGSDSILLRPGQAIRLPDTGSYDTRWIISNYRNQGAIIGTLLIGEGEFFDNRISGSVEVIDGGKNRTLAGLALIGSDVVQAVVGAYPYSQMWNPVGSGKNIFLESISVASGTAQGAAVGFMNVQLANVASNGGTQNKKLGGGAGVAQMRNENSTTFKQTSLFTMNIQASTAFVYKFTEPVLIAPGYGATLNGGGLNTDLRTMFEYFEESI